MGYTAIRNANHPLPARDISQRRKPNEIALAAMVATNWRLSVT
jgi:hypothetical protein